MACHLEHSWIPWTARRSNQSILKEISPEYSLEGLMLKLQYFGHLMQRVDSLEKDPDAGKDWTQAEKGTARDEMVEWHNWLDGHEFEQALRVGDGQGSLECFSLGVAKSRRWLNNWTELNWGFPDVFSWRVCLQLTTLLLAGAKDQSCCFGPYCFA